MDWEELFCMEIAPMPAVVVIFGATGDLARRKLFPALRNLHDRKLFNENSRIIACGRREYTDSSFRDLLGGNEDFLQHITYCRGDNTDDAVYLKLNELIAEYSQHSDLPFNKLFYLALASSDMLNVCAKLAQHGLTAANSEDCWSQAYRYHRHCRVPS